MIQSRPAIAKKQETSIEEFQQLFDSLFNDHEAYQSTKKPELGTKLVKDSLKLLFLMNDSSHNLFLFFGDGVDFPTQILAEFGITFNGNIYNEPGMKIPPCCGFFHSPSHKHTATEQATKTATDEKTAVTQPASTTTAAAAPTANKK